MMNSDHVATIREALTLLRDHYTEWVRGEWAREKVARIDAALAALDEDAGWVTVEDALSIYGIFLADNERIQYKRPPAQG